QRDLRLSMLFITHNLGVVACIADTVLVMDRGTLCETGTVAEVLASPSHDYTRRLLAAAPCLPDGVAGTQPPPSSGGRSCPPRVGPRAMSSSATAPSS